MIRAVKVKAVPKYVIELMSRAKYSYHLCGKNDNAAAGYTIEISKYSHYETADTFRKEIDRLKKWVERQRGGEMIIISYPTHTVHKTMQYATVTIYDPVMQKIEQYIGKREEKPLDLCDLMCK